MGLLSRIFGSKEIESVKELEKNISSLHEDSKCDIISFIGLSSRLKGLPLIYKAKDEEKLKQVTAQLIEFIPAVHKLKLGNEMKKTYLEFDDNSLFFKKITNKIGFFALATQFKDLTAVDEWLNENFNSIYNIFLVK
ncbi:MAG: hypothetical protein ACOC44_09860 [Promethearchaeia archaeon]